MKVFLALIFSLVTTLCMASTYAPADTARSATFVEAQVLSSRLVKRSVPRSNQWARHLTKTVDSVLLTEMSKETVQTYATMITMQALPVRGSVRRTKILIVDLPYPTQAGDIISLQFNGFHKGLPRYAHYNP